MGYYMDKLAVVYVVFCVQFDQQEYICQYIYWYWRGDFFVYIYQQQYNDGGYYDECWDNVGVERQFQFVDYYKVEGGLKFRNINDYKVLDCYDDCNVYCSSNSDVFLGIFIVFFEVIE